MTLTPTHLNRLMLPLWQAGVPRPTKHRRKNGCLTLVYKPRGRNRSHSFWWWEWSDKLSATEEDAETAHIVIESCLDRRIDKFLLSEPGRFVRYCQQASRIRPNGNSVYGDISDPDNNIRLLAKLALAYALLGMEMPKENQ